MKASVAKVVRPLAPKKAEPATMKKAAPALIPKRLGEARGLRVMPCIKAPATARLAPAIAAMKARGTLAVCIIKCSCEPL
ncbi:hypothetical protein D3C78_1496500 [compost metagenome]